jgi:hydrogenase maturation protease
VLGLGNLLLGDEGVGVHVAQRLAEMELPAGVEVIDGGTAPVPALATAGQVDRLIIVDALDAEGEAGEVYRLAADQVVRSGPELSLHELNLDHLRQSMEEWGRPPGEMVILGVVPGSISWGTELSAELEAKLPQILQAVLNEARRPHEEGARNDDCQRAQADGRGTVLP